ncbi:MAG TPA: hypothetical protein VKY27_06105 [Bacteriovoracaceae bacterium]|nr:hypothetical protein [Bacteriovoracaceae bacterium]
MKSQVHNDGELKELTVHIEKQIVDDLEEMERNTGIPKENLVVIALKRFCSSHSDYLKRVPKVE